MCRHEDPRSLRRCLVGAKQPGTPCWRTHSPTWPWLLPEAGSHLLLHSPAFPPEPFRQARIRAVWAAFESQLTIPSFRVEQHQALIGCLLQVWSRRMDHMLLQNSSSSSEGRGPSMHVRQLNQIHHSSPTSSSRQLWRSSARLVSVPARAFLYVPIKLKLFFSCLPSCCELQRTERMAPAARVAARAATAATASSALCARRRAAILATAAATKMRTEMVLALTTGTTARVCSGPVPHLQLSIERLFAKVLVHLFVSSQGQQEHGFSPFVILFW